MAVVQVAFRHRKAAHEMQTQTPFSMDSLTHQLRRLVVSEATTWERDQDLVLHWGDPACLLDAERLVENIQRGIASSEFGRSWIYYNRRLQQLTCAVDRLGLFPILLSSQAQQTYLASDTLAMAQLLGSRAEVEHSVLLDLLAYGQVLGNRSTLKNVQHLAPGSVCSIDSEGRFYLEYAKPYYPSEHSGNSEQALEALVSAVQQRFSQDPEALISLDGGASAWLLLAAAHAGGHCPDILSFSPPGALQPNLARHVAKQCGAICYHEDLRLSDFASAHSTVAQFGGGEVPLHQAHALICPELVTQTRGTSLLTAIGAEAYQGFYYARAMKHQKATAQALQFAQAQHWMLDSFSSKLMPFLQAFPSLSELLQSQLAARPSMYLKQAQNPIQYMDSLYLGEHLPRRIIAGQQLLARDYARAHPFLDGPVLESFLALPLKQRLDPGFYQGLIQSLSPKLAKNMELHSGLQTLFLPLLDPIGVNPGFAMEMTFLSLEENYSTWLAAPGRDAWQLLEQTLHLHGLTEAEIQSGIQALRRTPSQAYRAHLAGSLAAYTDWANYLADRRAVLAA